MAESAAFARRGFAGGAARTTLASDISDSAVTISCVSLSTWTGATTNGPITVTISRGQSDEEVIEATGISSNDLTGVTRHVDVGGTTPVAHDAGASVELTSRDRDFDEANRLVNLVLGVGSVVAGDQFYVSAASGGVPTALTRVGKGTAGQTWRMNSGATAPGWASGVIGSGQTATSQTGVGLSFTDLTNITTGSITPSGTTVWVEGCVTLEKKTSSGFVQLELVEDSTAFSELNAAALSAHVDVGQLVTIPFLVKHTTTASAHTFKVQARASSDTVDVHGGTIRVSE